jgi:hypothetical protein
VLRKYVIVGRSYRSFKCKPNSSYHSHLLQQTSNNQQIWMYSIQCNTQISYWRSRFSIISPKRIKARITVTLFCRPSSLTKWCRYFGVRTCRNRLPKPLKSTNSNAKCQNTSNWIGSSLVCQNFSRRNILKHYYKQKQNSQCTYIYLLL